MSIQEIKLKKKDCFTTYQSTYSYTTLGPAHALSRVALELDLRGRHRGS